jgi:hypothetical protein
MESRSIRRITLLGKEKSAFFHVFDKDGKYGQGTDG